MYAVLILSVIKMTPVKNLPSDVLSCHKMIHDLVMLINEKEKINDRLQHRLEQLLRAKYGPKTEKLDPNQLLLFAREILEKEESAEDESPEEVKAEPVESETPRRKGHGRNTRPELPRERIEYDIPEEEKVCPCCGGERIRIGEEISEQLEYVPAEVKVLEHVRYKYACKKCDGGMVTAGKPSQPIEKGLAGPGILAQTIVSKYADHLPLHRQQEMFRRYGVDLSRTTLCGWMESSASLLAPLYERMKKRVLESEVIHTDDTPVNVQDRKRKRKTRQGRVWVYVGDSKNPYVVYQYTPDRSREGPGAFLKKYRGYLQADAYGGYDRLYTHGGVTEVACWAHARRRFKDATSTAPESAYIALAYIAQLYSVERMAHEDKLDADGRRNLRQESSVPVLRDFEKWLRGEASEALPKSPIGEAIGYALNNWPALCRYTENGILSIDNNVAERALRPIAIGRKNWNFFGSDSGGRTGAILFSLVRSCHALGKNPFAYLRDVLTRIPGHSIQDLDPLLPDRWTDPSTDPNLEIPLSQDPSPDPDLP